MLRTNLLLALAIQTATATIEPDRLAAAEAASKANAATPSGKAYADELGRSFGREHAKTVGDCAKATRRPALTNFSLFIQAEQSGRVRSALVKPETNVAVCVRDRIKGWRLPAPPSDTPFWAGIEVKLQPR